MKEHKDGLRSECKVCSRKDQQIYHSKHLLKIAKRNKEYQNNPKNRPIILKSLTKCHHRDAIIMRRLKINGCAICGYNKCDNALAFHHTNPKDKKFALNKPCLNTSAQKVFDELNKCILLCMNCHEEIHEKERRYNQNDK